MDGNDSVNTALLVSDDEGGVLEMVSSMLEKAGFSVLSGGSAQAVLDRGRNEKTPIDLAVIDTAASGMQPAEIVRQLHEISPRVRMLFLYDKTGAVEDLALTGHVRRFLRKPVRRSKFLGEVLEMMDQPRALTA